MVGKKYKYISSATTTVLESGKSVHVDRILVTGGTAGAVTLYDAAEADVDKVFGIITQTANGTTAISVKVDFFFPDGFTVVTAAATSVTVIYGTDTK
jgi:hypothetical protein